MATLKPPSPPRRNRIAATPWRVASTGLLLGSGFLAVAMAALGALALVAPESGAQTFGRTPPRLKPPKSHDGFVVNVPSSIGARARAETTVSLRYDGLATTLARISMGRPTAVQTRMGTELTKGPFPGSVGFAVGSNEPWDSCRVSLPASHARSLVLLGVGGKNAIPLLVMSSDSFYLDPGALRQLSLRTGVGSVRLSFVPLARGGVIVPPLHVDLSVDVGSGRVSVAF